MRFVVEVLGDYWSNILGINEGRKELKQFHQLNICGVIKPALYGYAVVDLQLEDLMKM